MDKKLGGNLFLNIIYNILSIIVPFITAPYLGRVLGASQVGDYTYLYSIASYFVMFGMLGISNYGTRAIAQVRDNKENRSKVFCEIYAMQFMTGGIVAIVYSLYAVCFSNKKTLALIFALFVCSAMFDANWFCAGMEKFKDIVIRNTIIKLTNLILIFAFVRNESCLSIYIIIMALSYFISPLILWPSILKEIKVVKVSLKDIVKHFKPNVMLFIPAIAASVYQIMDKVMIGAISSSTQLAYYEYADKIIQIPNVVFGAIGAVMLSRMSNIVQNSEEKAGKLIGYSMDLSSIISFGFIFGILAVSNEFVSVYYGNEFAQSGIILSILAPVIFLYGWNNVLRMQYIIPKELDMIYIKSTFAGAVVNFALNFFLIPKFNAVGATIGTILAQVSIFVIYWIQLNKRFRLLPYLKNSIPVIAIGLIMMTVVKMIQPLHSKTVFGLCIDVSIGAFIYFVGCICLAICGQNGLLSLILSKCRGRINNG